MTTAEAIQMIHRMDMAELARAVEAIKLRRTNLARQKTAQLMVGDRVSFAGRRGMTVTGVVSKVNLKTVQVKQDNAFTTWKVPASMLKILDNEVVG